MTKIHTKIVLDMNSGAVERDDWHHYDGPVAQCGFIGDIFGGGDETTTTSSTPIEFLGG